MSTATILSSQNIAALRLQASQLQSSMIPLQKPDSREAGWLPSSAIGSGMDYAESRLYQHGDEPRTINWRLTARSTETYVKTYHMEARPSLCIVLDMRRPMLFGTRTRLKSEQALRLATILVFAAEQHRLPLNIMLIKQTAEWLEVGNSDAFLAKLNQQPSAQIPILRKPQIALEKVLPRLTERLKEGSLVYLISDFIDLEAADQKQLFLLQEHFFVQALQVNDPAEQHLEKAAGLAFQDMFSDAYIRIKADQNAAADFALLLQKQQHNIKQILLKSAIHYASVSTLDEALYGEIIFPLGH